MPYESVLDKKLRDKALNVIPIEVAENYKIICLAKDENKIKVGVTDPNNFKAFEAVDFLAKKDNFLYVGECKYRYLSKHKVHTDTALANYARFLDIKKGHSSKKDIKFNPLH